MYLPDFNYHRPSTLKEALDLLASCANIAPLAGGTDLLVEIKKGFRKFDDLVSLNSIRSLKKISENNGSISIGAGATHSEIIESEIIKKFLPALASTCGTIGSSQIRNTGTIGGNLCTCASCADTAPILLTFDAEVEITSNKGRRIILLEEFLKGHHINDLKKDELLTRIVVPKPSKNLSAYFEKFGLRNSAAISVVSIAISVLHKDNKIINNSVVIGASAPTPIKCPRSMNLLMGQDIRELNKMNENDKFLLEFGELVTKEIFPIDDIRGSGNYRRDIVKTISIRALLNVISQFESNGGKK